MGKKLAVTGHRPQNLNCLMEYGNMNDIAYMNYMDSISVTMEEHLGKGFDYFIVGGAIGVDMDFAQYFQYMKLDADTPKFQKAKLEIAVPCPNQDFKWSEYDKEFYHLMIERADYVIQISDRYSPWCMQKRNEYMVNKADKVIAFWNGEEHGGTWNTIQYAKKIGKEIEVVDLREICY